MATRAYHQIRDDDPHRLVCPNGHSSWKPVDGHFWCPYCEQGAWGCDGDFDRVYDRLRDELLDREAVRALEEEVRKQNVELLW